MCGRFGIVYRGAQLAEALETEWEGEPLPEPRYNVAPSQHAPVLRQTEAGPRLEMLRWGLIPSWAKDPAIGHKLANARAETAAEKPSFRSAFRSRRAVVPMSGFYEWQARPGGKVPHWIHPAGGDLLLAAGLWEEWRPRDAEPVRTFTVLTTTASDFMGRLHERMPVFLGAEEVARWMDPGTAPDTLGELLRPGAEALLLAHPVSTRVNTPRNDDPSLLEPVDGGPEQPLLL